MTPVEREYGQWYKVSSGAMLCLLSMVKKRHDNSCYDEGLVKTRTLYAHRDEPAQGRGQSRRSGKNLPPGTLPARPRPGAFRRVLLAGGVAVARRRGPRAAHPALALHPPGVRRRPHGGVRGDDGGFRIYAERQRPHPWRALLAG